MITESTAIVYVVDGYPVRRFLTKKAAINHLAWSMIKRKHMPCECEAEVGYTCHLHVRRGGRKDYATRLHDRLVRFINLGMAKDSDHVD